MSAGTIGTGRVPGLAFSSVLFTFRRAQSDAPRKEGTWAMIVCMSTAARNDRCASSAVVTHWPTCAPGGQLVAAIEARDTDSPGRLVVLDEAGQVRQRFEVMGAEFPEWGPKGTGVLFGQRPSSGPCMLWFVSEGGRPGSTGLSLSCDRVYLPRMYDWSATPPDGLPAG